MIAGTLNPAPLLALRAAPSLRKNPLGSAHIVCGANPSLCETYLSHTSSMYHYSTEYIRAAARSISMGTLGAISNTLLARVSNLLQLKSIGNV